jgi:ACS family glucarate transporter-like MFS transporter
MDRVNLSVATPEIMKEFGFTKMDMGYMQTAFFLGNALMQVPGGILSELFGHRVVVTVAVGFWSVFTAATALCSNLLGFIGVRFLFGAGEGPVYPAFSHFIARWFNKGEKGKAAAFQVGGTFFGPVIGPPVTIALMLAFGWRSVFVIFGLVGIVIGLIWYKYATVIPKNNNYVNSAELEHIQAGSEQVDDKKEVAPWSSFLGSRQFWAIGIQYFISLYIMYVFLTWLPLYLMEVHKFSLQSMGFAASIPWLGVVTMAFVTGAVSDRLVSKGVSKRVARTYFGVFGLTFCCIGLYFAATAQNPWMNVFWLTIALGALGINQNTSWTACNDIGGKFSASVGGWMNFCGNLGGLFAPLTTAWLATNYGWQVSLFFTAAVAVVGVTAWFWVNPDKPLRRKQKCDLETVS